MTVSVGWLKTDVPLLSLVAIVVEDQTCMQDNGCDQCFTS